MGSDWLYEWPIGKPDQALTGTNWGHDGGDGRTGPGGELYVGSCCVTGVKRALQDWVGDRTVVALMASNEPVEEYKAWKTRYLSTMAQCSLGNRVLSNDRGMCEYWLTGSTRVAVSYLGRLGDVTFEAFQTSSATSSKVSLDQ